MKKYLLKNLAIAALTGIGNGPILTIYEKLRVIIKKFRIRK